MTERKKKRQQDKGKGKGEEGGHHSFTNFDNQTSHFVRQNIVSLLFELI